MPALGAGVVYAIVTALLFHELLPVVTTHLYSDLGDPLLNASILEWSARHVPLSEAWWNFPSFAPLSGVTAFTEHLLAVYPLSAPIIWLTGSAVLAHNAVLLLAFPLNGLAAYLLAREVTRSSSGAFIGGLAFAFAPYVSVHLSHVQTLMAFGMPLGLLGLHRYCRVSALGIRDSASGARKPAETASEQGTARQRSEVAARIPNAGRALALFGVGWLFTAFSNAYMLVFFPVVVVLWCAWFIRPGEWRRLGPLVLTAVAGTLPLVPLLWGYRVRQAAYGFERQITEIRAFSADMVGLAGVSHREWLWRGILPRTNQESALFPGLTILALAIAAVWLSRGSQEPARPTVAPAEAGADAGLSPRAGHRRLSASAAFFLAAGSMALVVGARAWTGPFTWHLGPIPLPPFAPFRVATIAALAFLIGLVMTARFRDAWRRREPVMFYASAVVILWLLALGPQPEWSGSWRALTYGPYWLFLQLPGASSIRVPARAWLPAVLCLSVLAAAGAAEAMRRAGSLPAGAGSHRRDGAARTYGRSTTAASSFIRTKGVLAILTAGILAECWFFDRVVPAPAPMSQGIIPAGAMVLDLPIDEGFWNAIPQYRAVRSGYRTVNGYSGYEPPHVLPMRRAIADLHVDALNPYRLLADLYVIVRPNTPADVALWVTQHPGARRIHSSAEAQVFRLPRLNPDEPRRPLPLPLPAPRQRPFGLPY